MKYRIFLGLPFVLAMAFGPGSSLAQEFAQVANLQGRINYLDRVTGDITVDDYGARLIDTTRVVRGNLTLSQAQLRTGLHVNVELFLPYPEDRPREVKTITILDDGR